MNFSTIAAAFDSFSPSFQLGPFGIVLQSLIHEVLEEFGLQKTRKGTILTPLIAVWFVLAISIRRDLNYAQTLNWMVSGFRWIQRILPPSADLVKDGALSHARVRLGSGLFQRLFAKLIEKRVVLKPDFHGLTTVLFDGTCATMPDSEENVKKFGKPSSRQGAAAFPQTRIMCLMAASVRIILDVAYAPYRGKKTGERALLQRIFDRESRTDLLFIMDAGLYAFNLVQTLVQRGQFLIIKVPSHVNLQFVKRLPDGSFMARISDKIEDLVKPRTRTGRKRWKNVSIMVRAIRIQIPGFRPFVLITNIMDPDISAREIGLHYHKRWDIEIAYDEIKTHQCATLKGYAPTTFRSKRPDLVEQELYAILIMYNSVRLIIAQAAEECGAEPQSISFLDSLHHIIESTPLMAVEDEKEIHLSFAYLLEIIRRSEIDRPRRHRINPRVIKTKISKFERKKAHHKSEIRNLENDMEIIPCQNE